MNDKILRVGSSDQVTVDIDGDIITLKFRDGREEEYYGLPLSADAEMMRDGSIPLPPGMVVIMFDDDSDSERHEYSGEPCVQ